MRARFIDRATGHARGEAHADFLVGADGIHSAVRASFYPDEGPAKWNGAIIYRAVTESEPFLSGTSQFMAGGEQTVIGYPISKPRGGRVVTNWAARFFVDQSKGFAKEDWNRRADKAAFAPRYESWKFDWLDIPRLIREAPAVWEFPMVDRDPLPRWTYGRATLLGDAAHPMWPIGSNGASQAVLDCRALTDALIEIGRAHV